MESFRTAFPFPAKENIPAQSEVEYDSNSLFQVSYFHSIILGCSAVTGMQFQPPLSYVFCLTPLFSMQPVVFPGEASLSGLLRTRSISPNSLLETTISEEACSRDLEEEEGHQQVSPVHLPSTTSRRHTLAEVSARFHQCSPPCE